MAEPRGASAADPRGTSMWLPRPTTAGRLRRAGCASTRAPTSPAVGRLDPAGVAARASTARWSGDEPSRPGPRLPLPAGRRVRRTAARSSSGSASPLTGTTPFTGGRRGQRTARGGRGDAAGMSAASQAKRRAGDDLEVVALERGPLRVVLRLRHPLLGRWRRRLGRRPGRPDARRSTAGAASTCGCGTRSSRSTSTRGGSPVATSSAGRRTARLRPARARDRRRAGAAGPARRRCRRHATACRPWTTARRVLDALDATGRARAVVVGGGLHRHRDGRGDGAPRPDGHGASTAAAEPMTTLDPDMGAAGARGDGGHGHRRPDAPSAASRLRGRRAGACAVS